jgi:hypothetical protein
MIAGFLSDSVMCWKIFHLGRFQDTLLSANDVTISSNRNGNQENSVTSHFGQHINNELSLWRFNGT